MSNLFHNKKILFSLFIIAVALILANIIIEKFFLVKTSTLIKVEYSSEQINEKFKNILIGFGIDDSLIKSKTRSGKKTDQEYVYYSVTVPFDLPIPVILSDVFTEFKDICEIKSEEIVIGGKSSIELSISDTKILRTEFTYSKSIKRDKGIIGFFINDLEFDESEDSAIFITPEKFCVLITPSKFNSEIAAYTKQKGKEYAVFLNDDITELKFKIKSGYPESRIKSSIREILGAFSKSIFFVIDDDSDLYNSNSFGTIKNELAKRNIKFILLSQLNFIEEDDSFASMSGFDELIKGLKPDEQKPILVNIEQFKSLNEQIRLFRKLGVKFVNPSTMTFENIK